MKFSTGLALASGIGVALSFPGMGSAEQADKEGSVRLDAITVTANKIEENVQNVPQSITVINELMLEEKGIEDVPDIIQEVPNLTLNPTHGRSLNFRGLNTSMFTNANPVVLYIDGVAVVDRYGYDTSLTDVERVEVLRGPQGTLYGKDAIGGVINIITRDPGESWQGKVGAEYGSYNFLQGSFRASGPLVKGSLYGGVSAQYAEDDGWVENVHNGSSDDEFAKRENHNVSAYLLYKPSEKFRTRLTLTNFYDKKNGSEGYGLPGGSNFSQFSRGDAEKVNFDSPSIEENDVNSQNLNIQYSFGEVLFTSVTSHRKVDIDSSFDADFANNPLFAGLVQFDYTEFDTWSQELRLSSGTEKGIRWVGGVYFDIEDREQGPYGLQFPNFDPTNSTFLGNYQMNAESESEGNTYAAFGQVIVPFGELFELTVGARYQHIDREIDLNMYYLPVGVAEGPPMFQLEGDRSWDTFLPKAALSYKLSSDWTTFFSFSQGYMPGGFNYFATSGTPKENSFDPQQSTNYEFGIKGGFQDLQLSASVFYMNIEDIHVYKSVGQGIWLTDNAEKAHSYGAEMEFRYWLAKNIEVSGAAGVIEAEYDDYDAGGGITFDGEPVENTPEYSLRLGVAWLHPTGFYSRVDVGNQGSLYFYDDANKKMVKEDGYTTFDARIGYQFADWDIYAYGKNLTDEEHVTSFISNSMLSLATFSEPRTFGIGMRYRF